MTEIENVVSKKLLIEHLTTSGLFLMMSFVTLEYLWYILEMYTQKELFVLKVLYKLHIITSPQRGLVPTKIIYLYIYILYMMYRIIHHNVPL